jgi:hypothetical protein
MSPEPIGGLAPSLSLFYVEHVHTVKKEGDRSLVADGLGPPEARRAAIGNHDVAWG